MAEAYKVLQSREFMEYDGKTSINLKTEQFSSKIIEQMQWNISIFDHLYISTYIVVSEVFEFNGVQKQTNASG